MAGQGCAASVAVATLCYAFLCLPIDICSSALPRAAPSCCVARPGTGCRGVHGMVCPGGPGVVFLPSPWEGALPLPGAPAWQTCVQVALQSIALHCIAARALAWQSFGRGSMRFRGRAHALGRMRRSCCARGMPRPRPDAPRCVPMLLPHACLPACLPACGWLAGWLQHALQDDHHLELLDQDHPAPGAQLVHL